MKLSGSHNDVWVDARAYERFMGRWSRELARAFVAWLRIPPGRHWLEIGCGTGALTSCICEMSRPASVVAADPSEYFIAHARGALSDQPVTFLEATADEVPARAGGYDAVVSSLVLNFIPDPTAALRNMRILAADRGTVAACVWDYSDGMQFLRRWDAAVALDPGARRFDEGERFPICTPSGLKDAFRMAGLPRVHVEALCVSTHFHDFNDYWSPFVGGPGPAPGYLSSLSHREQYELARRLAATLPRNEDGSIPLTARAWAASSARD